MKILVSPQNVMRIVILILNRSTEEIRCVERHLTISRNYTVVGAKFVSEKIVMKIQMPNRNFISVSFIVFLKNYYKFKRRIKNVFFFHKNACDKCFEFECAIMKISKNCFLQC